MSDRVRVIDYGETALLAEVGNPHDVPVLRDAAAALRGVVDAVAGARTVLVTCPADARPDVRAWLRRGEFSATAPGQARQRVEIPVRYDGPDLAEVAEEVGWSPERIVAEHSGADYTVRFCGFAPGFAYLDGLVDALHVPRRREPRTRVPAGAVGIAGEFTGVYPRESPGGWRLIGSTDARLWNGTSDHPALLAPGTAVRFVPA